MQIEATAMKVCFLMFPFNNVLSTFVLDSILIYRNIKRTPQPCQSNSSNIKKIFSKNPYLILDIFIEYYLIALNQ